MTFREISLELYTLESLILRELPEESSLFFTGESLSIANGKCGLVIRRPLRGTSKEAVVHLRANSFHGAYPEAKTLQVRVGIDGNGDEGEAGAPDIYYSLNRDLTEGTVVELIRTQTPTLPCLFTSSLPNHGSPLKEPGMEELTLQLTAPESGCVTSVILARYLAECAAPESMILHSFTITN